MAKKVYAAAGRKKEEFDLDGDGSITEAELIKTKDMLELELREEKADTQRRMAVFSMVMIIVITGSVLYPDFVSVERIEATSAIISSVVYAFMGIVGFYMGATAWAGRNS